MFETFALRLATGLVMALVVLPSKEVHPRFYRIQWLILLALLGAAGVFVWESASEWFWLPFGLSCGLGVLGFWCWAVEELRYARGLILAFAVAALTATLMAQTGLSPYVVADLASAALLGLATTAMLMGHWYLISPTMSMTPLLRLTKLLFPALIVRGLTLGLELSRPSALGALDQTSWLWLLLRCGAGLVGPAILGWMAMESARIRSTQSATGILYVVVIFVFIGELTDQLLHAHLAEIVP